MRIIESMTSFFVHPCHVRVWREETAVSETGVYDNIDILAAVKSIDTYNIATVAQLVAAMPRVNAVEATKNGQGIIIYNDWP